MGSRHSRPDGTSRSAPAHDGHGHAHRPSVATPSAQRALTFALVLTGGFAVVEAAGGWLAGSLALLSDAGHMVTDAAALGLALFAQRIAARPPSRRASYGYARAEVIAAFVNALAMLAARRVHRRSRRCAGCSRRRRSPADGAGHRAGRPR